MAIQFARFESGGLHSIRGILQERVYRSQIRDVKELKERLLREWRLLGTPSSRQRLRGGIVIWMHVFALMVDILNINFEPLTFCCVLFVSSILVPLNVIDINMCKVLIHVLCEMFVSATFTWYGSNITMCGRKFLCQWLPHSLAKSCTNNYENLSIFVKVTAKNQWHLFYVDTVQLSAVVVYHSTTVKWS